MRMSFARSDADGRDEENACRLKKIRRLNEAGNPYVHATQRVGQQENERGTSFRWEEERVKCRTWRVIAALSLSFRCRISLTQRLRRTAKPSTN